MVTLSRPLPVLYESTGAGFAAANFSLCGTVPRATGACRRVANVRRPLYRFGGKISAEKLKILTGS